jgi:hypothetical protein
VTTGAVDVVRDLSLVAVPGRRRPRRLEHEDRPTRRRRPVGSASGTTNVSPTRSATVVSLPSAARMRNVELIWPFRGRQCSKRQRVAPCDSVVATPNAVWSVKRYRCQGGGPALGALNGAVNASPSTSAGHPPARYRPATRSSVGGSVTLVAWPSSTRSIPSRPAEMVQAGFAARLRAFLVLGPLVK